MKLLILILCFTVVACSHSSHGSHKAKPCRLEAKRPTCGSDGVVYPNPCKVFKNHAKIAKWEKCHCKNIACNLLFQPVCGSDGKIYPNRCKLLKASCEVKGKLTEVAKRKCCHKNKENRKNELCRKKHHPAKPVH